MPPMSREDHENLLGELLNADLDQTRRSEILQDLRKDYGSVLHDFSEMGSTIETQKEKLLDMTAANSKLFRELGVQDASTEEKQKEAEQTFSETVRIEDLGKNPTF